jgi:hypothetical protein
MEETKMTRRNAHGRFVRWSAFAAALSCSLSTACASKNEWKARRPDGRNTQDTSTAEALVQGSVSGSFPWTGEEGCKPWGLPITDFLSGVFGIDDLVEDTAVSQPPTECRHDQVLVAPADAWSAFAYGAICNGGGDPRLCGTAATRRCSLNLIMQWADERSAPVSITEPIFGFVIVVPPQEGAPRMALYRRARQELQTLLDETDAVAGAVSRNCPDEEPADLDAARLEAIAAEQRLAEVFDESGSQ